MKPRYLLALILVPLTVITVVSTLVWAQCWAFMPEMSILRVIFHKVCSVASEEARYPADIDILISSHDTPSDYLETRVKLSVGGQHIVYQPSEEYDKYRLYTVATQQTTDLMVPDSIIHVDKFVTDELILVEYRAQTRTTSERTWGLWNIKTAEIIAFNDINTEHYFAQGIPSDLQPLIQSHPSVFYFRTGYLLLVPTYLGDPTAPTTLLRGQWDYRYYKQAKAQIFANLRMLGVEPIDLDSVASADQTFHIETLNSLRLPSDAVANRTDSRRLVEAASGRTILTTLLDDFEPIGWSEGQRGVVLIQAGCIYVCVDGKPIVLQRQRAEYLTPAQQADFAAQDAKEADALQTAQRTFIMFIVGSSVLGIATLSTVLYAPRRETAVIPSATAA